ncbi:hypothetical protein TREMEDRAFT_59539 [Tremella mesenterica DSM 1558]|uniref:uncharacterized protein n=1 Tax=Tremella mesenterica (strain ATCC 24925 / CBS 8224 / DSM 1558 / NBRC 9311 / NRRL Y-6157 / RJB 2259-6 / UBC 559-6) TaxID=578456 RepID=UPI0003F4A3DC|nr:uncharacterized protein TREMEDRAFT_59539 [Tremella mesenterica DSM 1558]EIW73374.1 hypothetical protein TREMEDRAFT_59539 [Tremella mesenterica DSM 1558]
MRNFSQVYVVDPSWSTETSETFYPDPRDQPLLSNEDDHFNVPQSAHAYATELVLPTLLQQLQDPLCKYQTTLNEIRRFLYGEEICLLDSSPAESDVLVRSEGSGSSESDDTTGSFHSAKTTLSGKKTKNVRFVSSLPSPPPTPSTPSVDSSPEEKSHRTSVEMRLPPRPSEIDRSQKQTCDNPGSIVRSLFNQTSINNLQQALTLITQLISIQEDMNLWLPVTSAHMAKLETYDNDPSDEMTDCLKTYRYQRRELCETVKEMMPGVHRQTLSEAIGSLMQYTIIWDEGGSLKLREVYQVWKSAQKSLTHLEQKREDVKEQLRLLTEKKNIELVRL